MVFKENRNTRTPRAHARHSKHGGFRGGWCRGICFGSYKAQQSQAFPTIPLAIIPTMFPAIFQTISPIDVSAGFLNPFPSRPTGKSYIVLTTYFRPVKEMASHLPGLSSSCGKQTGTRFHTVPPPAAGETAPFHTPRGAFCNARAPGYFVRYKNRIRVPPLA